MASKRENRNGMRNFLCSILCMSLALCAGCGEVHYTVETTINGKPVGTTDVTVRYDIANRETPAPAPTPVQAPTTKSKDTEIKLSMMDSITVSKYDDGTYIVILFLTGIDDSMSKINYDAQYLYLLYNVVFQDLYGNFVKKIGGYVNGETLSVSFNDGEIEKIELSPDVYEEWNSYSQDDISNAISAYSNELNTITNSLGFGNKY